jgi:hypothetical protein
MTPTQTPWSDPNGPAAEAAPSAPAPHAPESPADSDRAWGFGRWFVTVVLVIIEAVLALAALWLISFGDSTTCGQAASGAEQRAGELHLAVAAGFGLVPWAIAAALGRRRTRIVVSGLLAVSPLLIGLVLGLDRGFWIGSFCF